MLKTITRQPGEPLTLENFFNALMAEYPHAMSHFCTWIDGYKKANKWKWLFAPLPPGRGGLKTRYPKFHHLPLAMQVGILLQFLEEEHGAWICLPPVDTELTVIDRLLEEMVHEICRMNQTIADGDKTMEDRMNSELDNMTPPDLVGY